MRLTMMLLGLSTAAACSASAATTHVGVNPTDARTFVSACRLAIEALDANYVGYTNEDLLLSFQCTSYVSGMVDGMSSISGGALLGPEHTRLCFPATAAPNTEAVIRRIVSMATEHPENLKATQAANYLLTVAAIMSTYGCGTSLPVR
ncbi:MAG TPA: hypothetical protein VGU65_12625 [Frateuria sp.]|uniref:hypothetical protein n=1 Tax=Frateuria sp. TaxID=2211372 RepID=UPI002DE79C83|nr:hypothetical protein [Frateuria sp.]